MKYSYKHLLIALTTVGFFAACTKDLGNYHYKDINDISITGLAENYQMRASIDTLKIAPSFSSSLDIQDENRYEFLWIAKDPTRREDTLARTLNLNYFVQIPPGTYALDLHVFDKETNLRWTKSSELVVGSAFSRGIMLIGEDENEHVDVDMLVMAADTSVARRLLVGSELPKLKGPISIQYAPSLLDPYVKLWLLTESGSYFLDRTTLNSSVENNFGKSVFSKYPLTAEELQPVAIGPQSYNMAGTLGDLFQSARVTVTKGGYMFGPNLVENAGDFFGNPINSTSDNLEVFYKASPYLFYSPRSSASMIWYDQTNERFLYIPTYYFVSASQKLVDAGGELFPWNQAGTGRTLIYGENTLNGDEAATNGNSFALMKDQQQDLFIYRFYVNGAIPARNGYFPINKTIAANIDRATQYAFASNRTVLFYLVDNKLFAYDYNPGNERLYALSPTGSDPITMIKFGTQINLGANSLYIASYNNTDKGVLQRFTMGTNPNTVEITPVANEKWTNLVKVKNISWRGRN
ncbi:PKD-like family lipoprotein [Sphingobacterium nematocida]|nr:PKD-like family lipoprotein [Sphingobacterium nematocida]